MRGVWGGRRVVLLLTILACTSPPLCAEPPREGSAEVGGGQRSGGCSSAKTVLQLLDRARELRGAGKQGKLVSCLKKGARAFPASADVWEELGSALEESGRLDEAERAFSRTLELDPGSAIAALRLGNIVAGQDGRGTDAVRLFEAAAALRPDSPIPHNNIGLAYMREGDTEAALEAFERGLSSTQEGVYGRSMILNNLGHLYNKMSMPDLALGVLERAILDAPTLETFCNLAQTLIDGGDYARAEEVVQMGMQNEEGARSVLAVRLLVTALMMQDRHEDAVRVLRQLPGDARREATAEAAQAMVQAGRGHEGAWLLLSASEEALGTVEFVEAGRVLLSVYEQAEALRSYAAALRLQPDHPGALKEAAFLVYGMGRYSDSEGLFRRLTVAKDADDAYVVEAYNGLGAATEMTHTRLDDAVRHFRLSHSLNPGFIAPFFSLVHLLGRICDWGTWEGDFAKVRGLIRQGMSAGIGPIFALSYPLQDEEMCEVARSRAREFEALIVPVRPDFIAWEPNWAVAPERLAVGVISADFNARPVGQLFQRVFSLFDRMRFELFAFGLAANDGSQVLFNIHNASDDFFFVQGMPPLAIAELINSVQVHVLIDLNGYTEGGRLEVAALGPAAVSINYLGYPYTCALAGIDYVLTDRVVTPPEHMSCFTEMAAFLPNTYMVNDHRQSQQHQVNTTFTPGDAKAHGLPHHDTGVVLANFNHLQKLGPGTFKLWTSIMAAAQGARLWLLRFPREAEAHIRKQAEEHGIDPQRLLFTDKFADAEHLRVKRAASMLLDTLEYNAHASGLDALWAGLPLVTMAGGNMARRCGASFLRTLGLPELLGRTPDEYVAIGAALSTRPRTLAHLRERVEVLRYSAPLFDTQRWVRELEVMLLLMWDVAASKKSRWSNLRDVQQGV